MKKQVLGWFFLFAFVGTTLEARSVTHEDIERYITATRVVQIMHEEPDLIDRWEGEKLYLSPKKISLTHQGACLCGKYSEIRIPRLSVDHEGAFMICAQSEVSQEAQEHLDNAKAALIEAVGFSMSVPILLDIPPLAVIDAYKAVEAWKETAREYNAYCEIRDRDANSSAQNHEPYGSLCSENVPSRGAE